MVFCKNCRKLIEARWLHCPWCGEAAGERPGDSADEGLERIIDTSLNRLRKELPPRGMGVLEGLSRRLNTLEDDLNSFLSGQPAEPEPGNLEKTEENRSGSPVIRR